MSAKELLDKYSEFLNQTSLDSKFDPSIVPTPVDSDPSISLPSSQVIDQLLPIIGFFIYLGLRLIGSILTWFNRWRLFRRTKKTGSLHSLYYTMTSSTVSGNFVKIIHNENKLIVKPLDNIFNLIFNLIIQNQTYSRR